jgi:hypothetical protein
MLTFNLGRETASTSTGEVAEARTVEPEASGMPLSDDQHVPPAKQVDGD